MIKIVFLICFIVCIQANVISRNGIESFTIDHVNFINSLNTSWKAALNFEDIDPKILKGWLGTHLEYHDDDEFEFLNTFATVRKAPKPQPIWPENKNLPDNFDARKQWPKCEQVISHVRDQGSCGSCWAVSVASAITARVCIASDGKNQTELSSQDITSCCTECFQQDGCHGGWPIEAWGYWVKNGIKTGGDYGDKKTCQPYLIPPCEHHVEGPRPKCGNIKPAPACSSKCSNNGVSDEKNYGKAYFRSSNSIGEIKTELAKRGPMSVSFIVYDDFYNYKEGVYRVTPGAKPLGGHAVTLIGWGKDADGTEYWICKNNWNTDWGIKGFFNIKMGEASINSNACSGIAKGPPK